MGSVKEINQKLRWRCLRGQEDLFEEMRINHHKKSREKCIYSRMAMSTYVTLLRLAYSRTARKVVRTHHSE